MRTNYIDRLSASEFTAFGTLIFQAGPGLNVLIGTNGTGKSHVLKLIYAATRSRPEEGRRFADKLAGVFQPRGGMLGRLVRRGAPAGGSLVNVHSDSSSVSLGFDADQTGRPQAYGIQPQWFATQLRSVFIPAKEILSHAPGFRSLIASREISFDETYADIIDLAFLPRAKGVSIYPNDRLIRKIQGLIGGSIEVEGEEFMLAARGGTIEFSLLAEGWRKLGLLMVLLRNSSLGGNSILLWDEPESNLNPELHGEVAQILLDLELSGSQIFVATHSYSFLKQIELKRTKDNSVTFHSFAFGKGDDGVSVKSTTDYDLIEPNPILDAYVGIHDAQIARALARMGDSK